MSAEAELPALWATAIGSVLSRTEPDGPIFQRRKEEELASELPKLERNDDLASEIVGILYAGGPPTDRTFYDSIVSFSNHLTFTATSQRIVGIVWAKALSGLTSQQIEQVLLELPSVNSALGRMVEALPTLFGRIDLSARAFLRWAEAMVVHIGSKYGGLGLEVAIADYADRRSVETIELLNTITATETNFGVLSVLAGRLRVKLRSGPPAPDISGLLNKLKGSRSVFDRNVFYQSWIQEAVAGALTSEDLEDCFATAAQNPVDDLDFLFRLLCKLLGIPRVPPDVFRKGARVAEPPSIFHHF